MFMPAPQKHMYITSTQTGYNVGSAAGLSASNFDVFLFINAPVNGNSSSAAMITGTSWRSGTNLRLINANTITGVTGTTGSTGANGTGGNGGVGGGQFTGTGPGAGTAGSAGGTGSTGGTGGTGGIALTVSSVTGMRVFLHNANGSIIGGVGGSGGSGGSGGGGGGGGGGAYFG